MCDYVGDVNDVKYSMKFRSVAVIITDVRSSSSITVFYMEIRHRICYFINHIKSIMAH